MDAKYDLIFTGQIQAGFTAEDVVANLLSTTKMDPEKVTKLLAIDKPTPIRRGLEQETAKKYLSRLQKTGLELELVKSIPVQEQPAPGASEPTREKKSPPVAPVSRKKPPVEAATMAAQKKAPENPYASPKADLKTETRTEGRYGEPQKVPIGNAWLWFKSACGMFLEAPWKWLGMAIVSFLILIPLNFIPIIGSILNTMLMVLLAGGLMIAAQHQTDGDPIKLSYLFKCFSHNRNQLLLVAAYYLGVFVLLGVIMGIVMGTGLLTFTGFGDPQAIAMTMQEDMLFFALIALIIAALSIPFMMAYWFTTPLVALSDQKALAAYKLSFQGCLKNWLVFLVYGLIFLAIFLIGAFGVGLISGALAFFLGNGGSIIVALLPMLIMAVLFVPLMIVGGLSVFTSFRDIYLEAS